MSEGKTLHCVECGKELHDGGYIALENWLQWHHYTKIGPPAKANCYCSAQCFADYWYLKWMDADEFD